MLYLTRKIDETIVINNDIEVSVVGIKGKTVKLGITFPEETTILRKEIHKSIEQENYSMPNNE